MAARSRSTVDLIHRFSDGKTLPEIERDRDGGQLPGMIHRQRAQTVG